MKTQSLKISTVSLLCVLYAGFVGNAFAAASVRTLGGTGTVNGTAAVGTSTRSAPTRAASLRVSPSNARLVTTTTSSGNTATSGATSTGSKTAGTTQRLSIGKDLGGATTTAQTGMTQPEAAALDNLGDQVDALDTQVGSIDTRVEALENKNISGTGVVVVDQDGVISVDVDELIKELWGDDANAASRETEVRYTDGHDLQWRYVDESETEDGGWKTLFNTNDLTGDYATTAALNNAISGLASTYATKGDLNTYKEYVAEHYQVKATTLAGYGITDAYTKTQVDAAIAAGVGDVNIEQYAKTADVNAALDTKANAADVNDALALKADKETTYTKTETNTLLSAKANAADVASSFDAVDAALDTKADKSDTYTKDEIDTQINALSGDVESIGTQIDSALETYTTETLEPGLDAKADKATTLAGYGIGDAYTKTETDTKLDTKANAADVESSFETVNATLGAKANAADLATVATTGSCNDLNSKPTTIAGYGITDAYTKSETYSSTQVDEKLEAISGDNGSISQQINTALADYTPTSTLNNTYAKKSELPTIDTALSLTSTNPVQNKTITEYLNERFSTESLEMLASGEWVFGFVGGQPQYIKIVDANGN